MAKRKQKARRPARPSRVSYSFEPRVPTYDILDELDVNDAGDLGELVDYLTGGSAYQDYLTWEAVLCEEQGLPLTSAQEEALSELLDFSEDESEEILYINELPRPKRPWYELVRAVAERLILDPLRTDASQYQVYSEGWPALASWLEEEAGDLSLPEGLDSALEVVAPEIRHRLELQSCFDECLGGLGSSEELSLERAEEQNRLDELLECLRENQESVAYLGLTLERFLTMVRMPAGEEALLVEGFSRRLGLPSAQAPLIGFLSSAPPESKAPDTAGPAAQDRAPRPADSLDDAFDFHAQLFDEDGDLDERAFEQYEESLLERFAHSPEGRALTDEGIELGWSENLLHYGAFYEGVTPATMTAAQVQEIVFGLIPRKVVCPPEAAEEIVQELRAFLRFMGREFRVRQAPSWVKVLEGDAARRLRGKLSDPGSFGMGKSFAVAGQQHGYDIATEEGLQAWVKAHNLAAAESAPGGELGRVPAGPSPQKRSKAQEARRRKRKQEKTRRKRKR